MKRWRSKPASAVCSIGALRHAKAATKEAFGRLILKDDRLSTHDEAGLVNRAGPARLDVAGPGRSVRLMKAVIRIETSSPGSSTPSLAT